MLYINYSFKTTKESYRIQAFTLKDTSEKKKKEKEKKK